MNVVIYARFSSDRQTEQSIEGQIKVCQEYAKAHDYTVIGEYIDRAMTGRNDDRPNFQKMIGDSYSKQFQGVLVYQLDRFSRNRYDSAKYKATLKKNGVRVISALENITDDASGIFLEAILEGYAEFFSVELSQKVKRGMNINAEKCLSNGGIIPLGYKSVDKHLVIDENTAPYVKKIFQMYADGSRVVDIIKYLNEKGLRTAKGGEFKSSSLHNLLKNKKYIGVYKYGDVEIPDGIPRIISDELFNEVAQVLEKNKKYAGRSKAKVEYLLTTKLFCGKCKSMMVGYSATSHTGKVYNYYACNKSRKKECDKKIVSKKLIEDFVISQCCEMLTDENINKIAKEVENANKQEGAKNIYLKHLEQEIKKNETETKNLLSSLKQCNDPELQKIVYTEMASMKEIHSNLEKEIAIEKKKQVSLNPNDIKFFLTQLKDGNIDDIRYRKLLINVFINAVFLYDDKITLIFNVKDSTMNTKDIPIEVIEKQSKGEKGLYINYNGSP